MAPLRKLLRLCGLTLSLALSMQLALGQGHGGSAGQGSTGNTGNNGGIPGNTGNTGNTGTSIPGPTGTNNTTTAPGTLNVPESGANRPLYLSGRVMMDDGTAPPETVTIERVCGLRRYSETYTDSKGRFGFQVGQNEQLMPDASISESNMRSTPLDESSSGTEKSVWGCELRALLPGYRSESVNLSGRRALDSPEVGTIVLHRMGDIEGSTISMTSIAAPKEAKKAYEKGTEARNKKKWAEAEKQLSKAVELYPKYAAAWFELGAAYDAEQNAAEARKAYGQSLAADPKYLRPYLPLIFQALRTQNWQDVADTSGRLVRLDPIDYPQAFMFNAIANFNLKKFDAAEQSAREAVRLDPQHRMPRAEYTLGIILASKQDFAGALPLLKSYVEHAGASADVTAVKKQIAQIEAQVVAGQPRANRP